MMKYLNEFIVLAILSGVSINASAHTEGEGLCLPFEEVYFSCRIGEKIMSLCAVGNVSPDNGYVKYRFGTAENIELEYPDESIPSRGVFSISDINLGRIGFVQVKFHRNDHDYVIFGGYSEGIYVQKAGKLVVRHGCESEDLYRLSPRAYRGIETVPPVDEIDD